MGKRRVMLIRRFDRYWALPGQEHDAADDLLVAQPANGRTEHRLGFVSGLTLLGCDETESRAKAYADLAQAVRKYCHTSLIRADNAELFSRMVYFEDFGVTAAEIDRIAPAFRHIEEIASPALRRLLP